MCSTCIQYPLMPKNGTRSPGTEVTGVCKLLHGCWEMNPGSVQEQVLLTAEPSF